MIETSQNTLDTSSVSTSIGNFENTETIKVKNYTKDLLKSRIFLGGYMERRLISQRTSYRDVILLSAAEVELKKDLLDAEMKLRRVLPDEYWIGITNAEIFDKPSDVCIWTEIENQPFGAFWFQIKSVRFRDNEVIILVKCIRHISDAYMELEPLFAKSTKNSLESKETKLDDTIVSFNESCNQVLSNLKSVLSIKNLSEFITFLFAFVIAFFTGGTTFVVFLGNFILALVREFSILIKNSTPMFLGILDFFGKIIGGFYILLAMFFKPNTPVRNERTLTYTPKNHFVPYSSKDFD
ncbi:uncharacterized protein [Battus philenor]|uniref:uncharacterized protein n=1 Tax=Battus philenor TaxID=42288 RepID=UPI0035D08716